MGNGHISMLLWTSLKDVFVYVIIAFFFFFFPKGNKGTEKILKAELLKSDIWDVKDHTHSSVADDFRKTKVLNQKSVTLNQSPH